MRVVRKDLLRQVVKSVESATEWPHYAIFVYLRTYDAVVITGRNYLHGDLFVMLKRDWDGLGFGDVELIDADVFDGHIEWDDDGSFRILTERGERLPEELEMQLTSFLKESKAT